MTVSKRLLVVDDDPLVRCSLRQALDELVDDIQECADGRAAISAALADPPGAMLLDLGLPDVAGIDVLSAVKAELPDLPIVVISGGGSIENAVEAMRRGAQDFVTKPVMAERVQASVRNALHLSDLGRRVNQLEAALATGEPFACIIGRSPSMRRLFASLRKLGRSSATVLIQGETGVGKDLVARALHSEGARARGPFIEVNCAAIPAELLENELFGHERDAFTGAHNRRVGKIEAADGGTLFLDEVGELDLSSQAKLLRVLQNRRVERLGSTRSVPVDVRVVAATNRNLAQEVESGRFRADLYYRLSVYPVYVPPLRERAEDIPPLVEHFLERAASAEQRPRPVVARDAMDLLLAYEWPGNARELENVIRRAMISLEDDILSAAALSAYLGCRTAPSAQHAAPAAAGGELLPLCEVERNHVVLALERCEGNLSETARTLGISRTTLYRKIEKYGLAVRS